ncbi:MAG: SUMF1/EgtB/PvdO family nonheme iron enzyme [Verrucomicrobiota bacterium]
MRSRLTSLFVALTLLASIRQDAVHGAQFFRISGPAATIIIAYDADGTLIWSNAETGNNYSIQTVSALGVGRPWQKYVQLSVTRSVNTNHIALNLPAGMALIPGGSFTMGDNLDGEFDAIPTNVFVSGFFMDTNLVSSNQWAEVYAYAISQGYTFANAGGAKAANYPIEDVDWYDCLKWSNARSQQAGLTPVYYADSGLTEVFTSGDYDTAVYANWEANGYRLPTEAEWEMAARGGSGGERFPLGNTISWSQANYYGDPRSLSANGFTYDNSTLIDYDPVFSGGDGPDYPYTSPVGYFPKNGYGLHDMEGNVFEWCWDQYAIPYGQPTTTNPTGPTEDDPMDYVRVLRGGSWFDTADKARCAYRGSVFPNTVGDAAGFRCVRKL